MRRESDTLRPGDRAPAFTLHDANGRAHTLADLLGAATNVPACEKAEAERADRDGRSRRTPAALLLVFDRGTW
jgi:hypothetical protein